MEIIYNRKFLGHDTKEHPENRKRLESLGELPEQEIIDGEQFLELVHTRKYINQVKDSSENEMPLDKDTILSKESYSAAVAAVGATMMASESNGFAVVRPPGHHAHPSKASGFCLFNNVAIASQKLVNEGKKVFILDFDGHLGDGTEQFFYNTNKVLYMSLHQFPAFPGGGSINEIGAGKGKGYTVNVQLPPGSGDDIYWNALNRIIPITEQFNPDVVGISAGFDALQYDNLLDLRLSMNMYHKIGTLLGERFSNIFAVLEGGYNIDYLGNCVYNFLDGINGKKIRFKERVTDSRIIAVDEYESRAIQLEKNLSKYWNLK